jgi:hypothetical protein
VGELVLPIDGANAITVSGWADNIRGAIRKASAVAARVASDPMLSAMLPPGAGLAIAAAQKLSRAADSGKPALKAALNELRGPGAARLARVLRRDVQRRPVTALPATVEPVATDDDQADDAE